MKKLRGNFTTIPNEAIMDKRLDAYEFKVLCYLCKLSNEDNTCSPSYTTIADNTNISRSKIGNIINRLIFLGYIKKENRTKGRGGIDSNIYTVCAEDYEKDKQYVEKTIDDMPEGHRDSLSEEPDSMSGGLYKEKNINNNYFINNQSSSIERLMDQAETYNLDQFMLGNDILVAPVVTENTYSREVVFPSGKWKDELGNIYEGNTKQMIDAHIERLLWFERV